MPREFGRELAQAEILPERNRENNENDLIKEKLLEFLRNNPKENPILTERDGRDVVDLENLQKPLFLKRLENIQIPAVLERSKKHFDRSIIFQKLADMPVVSLHDCERAQKEGKLPVAKPLFNVPQSVDEVFNPEIIRKKEYHLNVWEMYPERVTWKPITAKNGEAVDMREMFLATELYRNHNVHRNEKGQLLVSDPNKDEDVPVSGEWIGKNIKRITGAGTEGRKLITSNPQEFITKIFPTLMRKKLLLPEDVEGGFIRKEKRLEKKNAYFSHDGASYYIARDNFIFNGKKIPKENIKVVELDGKTMGIVGSVSGHDQVLYVFGKLSDQEKNDKHKALLAQNPDLTPSQLSQRTQVGKKEMMERLRSWLKTEDNPRHPGESAEKYAERLGALGNYNELNDVTGEFSRLGIGIHNLSWREQQWLAAASYGLKMTGEYDKLVKFGRDYNLTGLKSFLSCEFDLENGRKIIAIGEKLPKEKAETVFNKTSEIINLAEQKSDSIQSLYEKSSEDDVKEIKHKLLERVNGIILDFSSSNKKNIEKLLKDFGESRAEIVMLSALLKTAKENGEKIVFEMIKNLKLDKRIIGERDENGEEVGLGEEEKEEMMKMVEKNYREAVYPDNKEAAKAVIADFKKELDEGLSGQMVYTLRFQDQLAAFVRFKKLNDQEVYAGSLNIDQEVNNLCIGKYFTDSVLPEVAKNFRIKAITRATNPAIPMYEKQGFQIDKDNPFSKHGEQYYNIVMERSR